VLPPEGGATVACCCACAGTGDELAGWGGVAGVAVVLGSCPQLAAEIATSITVNLKQNCFIR
jgi:hypothetical protein